MLAGDAVGIGVARELLAGTFAFKLAIAVVCFDEKILDRFRCFRDRVLEELERRSEARGDAAPHSAPRP